MLAPTRPAALWLGLWALTAVALVVAVVPAVIGDADDAGPRLAFASLGTSFAACGLIAWRRRPDSRSGIWMVATGLGLFVAPVFADVDSPTVEVIADLCDDAWGLAAIALLLTFMTGGRLEQTADRVLVGGMVVQNGVQVVRHFVWDKPGNFLLIEGDSGLADAFGALFGLITAAVCLGTAVVIGVRFRRASAPRRRAMLPSVAGISALLFVAIAQPESMPEVIRYVALLSLLLVPAAFLAGLLRSRLAGGDLSRLLGELRTLRGGELQARLARAVGDPGLVIAYGHPGALVDYAGHHVEVGPGRSLAPLDQAALIYDSSLDQDPGLIEAAASAAAIALDHERAQAARRRMIAAADAERRGLERDLHGGAQQRLAAVAMQLRLVQADLYRDPAAAEARVTTASGELARSLEELRALARGIHPAELDHGLAAALTSLAAGSAVRTTVSCAALGDLPRPVELALYLVAADALAGVTGASGVTIRVARTMEHAAIEVAHDGTAEPLSPAVRDRVEALGGRLTEAGAELPCVS